MAGPPPIPPPVSQAILVHPQASKYLTVRVNDGRLLKKFCIDLKAAAEMSDESGGLYSAFLHLADGRKLQIEVGFPTQRTNK